MNAFGASWCPRASCTGQHRSQREEDLLRVPEGYKFVEPGHTLYIADFDAQQRTITNPQADCQRRKGKPIWFAYTRWIEGEAAVVYHCSETGKGQLYVYRLDDGSTTRVSTNLKADYRYPHGEAAPC